MILSATLSEPAATEPYQFDGRRALARLEALGVVRKWRAHNDGAQRTYHVLTDQGIAENWSEHEVRRFMDGALLALRAVRDGNTVWDPYHKGFRDARDIPKTRHHWELSNLVSLGIEFEPKRSLEEITAIAAVFEEAG